MHHFKYAAFHYIGLYDIEMIIVLWEGRRLGSPPSRWAVQAQLKKGGGEREKIPAGVVGGQRPASSQDPATDLVHASVIP